MKYNYLTGVKPRWSTEFKLTIKGILVVALAVLAYLISTHFIDTLWAVTDPIVKLMGGQV